mgnify:FL=1
MITGMKLEQVYDGQFFPCYYYEPHAATVAVTSKSEPENTDNITWLYLPMAQEEIDRALQRAEITDFVSVRLRLVDTQLPNEVAVLLDIDDSKVAILIRHDIVVMDVDTLQFFRGYYHSCLYMLISKHIMDYMQLMTSRIFEYEELCEILTWDVDDSIKLGLLKFTAAPVSITGKTLSQTVRVYILRNNLNQSDMENLYRSYDDEPQPIKEIIFNNAVDNITRITSAPQSVSAELLYDIIVSDAIANLYKVDLIIADISCADRTEISKYLFALHLDEFVKIFDSRSRPKFENTSDNVAILNAFKARGWIYDYILDEAGYFKIRRHAPRLVSKTN